MAEFVRKKRPFQPPVGHAALNVLTCKETSILPSGSLYLNNGIPILFIRVVPQRATHGLAIVFRR
jgi:hypothetical protein